MDYALYASLAGNALFAVGGLIFAAKLSDARLDRDEAQEGRLDAQAYAEALERVNIAHLEELNASLLAENADLRAKEAKRMAPLIAANAARKAAATAKTH